MLQVQTYIVGLLQTNCYLVTDVPSRETIIIDPGDDASYIAEKILSGNLKPAAVLATHGHFDHVLSAFELQQMFAIPFYVHPDDEFLLSRMRKTAEYYLKRPIAELPPVPSTRLRHKTFLLPKSHRFSILPTPGHTPGSVSYFSKKEGIAFVGDTVFAGGAVGDWRHAYSDKQTLFTSIGKLLSLPKDTALYPGHGGQTTVEKELVSQNMKI